jgi:hypothetical protein
LLILINPLIEIGLEEVDLLGILQQTGPELLLELLLSEDKLDVLSGVVDLALCLVNFCVELQLQEVVALEGVRVAGELERLRLELQL